LNVDARRPSGNEKESHEQENKTEKDGQPDDKEEAADQQRREVPETTEHTRAWMWKRHCLLL
jgi:hypothetical protein